MFTIIRLTKPTCAKSKRLVRHQVPGEFECRRAARRWCLNHRWDTETERYLIRHPDGSEEAVKW